MPALFLIEFRHKEDSVLPRNSYCKLHVFIKCDILNEIVIRQNTRDH